MRRGITAAVSLAAAAICFACVATSALGAGFSDSYAGRETASGLPLEFAGSNVGATAEAEDPKAKPFSPRSSFVPAGHSVWAEWEALATEYVTVSACSSGIPVVLGIYETSIYETSIYGRGERLARAMPTGSGCTPLEEGFTFRAVAGRHYELFVDGDADSIVGAPKEGPVFLRIEATPRPPNDDFASADALTGKWEYPYAGQFVYHIDRTGYTWAATAEPGEPKHGADAAGASVWYQWTAPETGKVEINLGDQGDTRFAVYRGESLGTLERVFDGFEYGVLPVVGGTSYRIAVDAALDEFGPEMATFYMRLSMYKTVPLDPIEVADRRPPRTAMVSRRIRPKARSATFRFRSDEAKSRFRCRLDRRKPKGCVSPKTYSGLRKGRHVFTVYAIDAAGNLDATPVVARFAIPAPKTRHGAAGHPAR